MNETKDRNAIAIFLHWLPNWTILTKFLEKRISHVYFSKRFTDSGGIADIWQLSMLILDKTSLTIVTTNVTEMVSVVGVCEWARWWCYLFAISSFNLFTFQSSLPHIRWKENDNVCKKNCRRFEKNRFNQWFHQVSKLHGCCYGYPKDCNMLFSNGWFKWFRILKTKIIFLIGINSRDYLKHVLVEWISESVWMK